MQWDSHHSSCESKDGKAAEFSRDGKNYRVWRPVVFEVTGRIGFGLIKLDWNIPQWPDEHLTVMFAYDCETGDIQWLTLANGDSDGSAMDPAPAVLVKKASAQVVAPSGIIRDPGDDWRYTVPEDESIPAEGGGSIIGAILAFLTAAALMITTGMIVFEGVHGWKDAYREFIAVGLLATQAVLQGVFEQEDLWIEGARDASPDPLEPRSAVASGPMSTSMPPTCGLCDFQGRTEVRNFGLDLCEPCSSGYLTGRLHHWGAEIEVDELDVGRAEEKLLEVLDGKLRADVLESDTALRVVGRIENAPPLIATFFGKTLKNRVLGLFRRRFSTGDPLFDARVEVETRTEALVRELVRNDGFQSAVMTLVTHCGALRAQPGRVEVIAPLTELDLRSELPLAVGAILRHLANRA